MNAPLGPTPRQSTRSSRAERKKEEIEALFQLIHYFLVSFPAELFIHVFFLFSAAAAAATKTRRIRVPGKVKEREEKKRRWGRTYSGF